jgi:Putative peptidoglycan binding domain
MVPKHFDLKHPISIYRFNITASLLGHLVRRLLLLIYILLIADPATSRQLLKLGDRGRDVAALQKDLLGQGLYNGPLDGVYGEQTREAVEKFQQIQNLTPDGVAGEKTWSLLEQRLSVFPQSKLNQFFDLTINNDVLLGFVIVTSTIVTLELATKKKPKSSEGKIDSQEGSNCTYSLSGGTLNYKGNFDCNTKVKVEIKDTEGKIVKSFDKLLSGEFSETISLLPGQYICIVFGRREGKNVDEKMEFKI